MPPCLAYRRTSTCTAPTIAGCHRSSTLDSLFGPYRPTCCCSVCLWPSTWASTLCSGCSVDVAGCLQQLCQPCCSACSRWCRRGCGRPCFYLDYKHVVHPPRAARQDWPLVHGRRTWCCPWWSPRPARSAVTWHRGATSF